VKLRVEGKVSEGDKIYEGEKGVGVITSLNSKGSLALGYLLRGVYEEGKEFTTEGGKVRVEGSCE